MSSVRSSFEECGQGHLFSGWDALSTDEKDRLISQLSHYDPKVVMKIFEKSMRCASGPRVLKNICPVEMSVISQIHERSGSTETKWAEEGWKLIREGRVAIVVLAGGQGTRLGFSKPKGCYDVGLPSRKTLFQLIAERVLKAEKLAEGTRRGDKPVPSIPVFILTSDATRHDTCEYFEAHKNFGLSSEQLRIIKQDSMPCFTESGKIIMSDNCSIAESPNGNSGVFPAIPLEGLADDVLVQVIPVDNILVRVPDPVFLGFAALHGHDVSAKVLRKSSPSERVGAYGTADVYEADDDPEPSKKGGMCVVEYTEMTDELRKSLVWGNPGLYVYSVPFLRAAADLVRRGDLGYHIARKKIPSWSEGSKVDGVKLEGFIFDTFVLTDRIGLFEIERGEEFSPVKNAPGDPNGDSPDTARQMAFDMYKKWAEEAGAVVEGLIEITPNRSLLGEGLGELKGKTIPDGTILE